MSHKTEYYPIVIVMDWLQGLLQQHLLVFVRVQSKVMALASTTGRSA